MVAELRAKAEAAVGSERRSARLVPQTGLATCRRRPRLPLGAHTLLDELGWAAPGTRTAGSRVFVESDLVDRGPDDTRSCCGG